MTVLNLVPEEFDATATAVSTNETFQEEDDIKLHPLTIATQESDSGTVGFQTYEIGKNETSCGAPSSTNNDNDLHPLLQCIGCNTLLRISDNWPRLSAIIFRVIIPMFSLIIISMAFGFWLAQIEGPEEIKRNNGVIAVQEALFRASQLERLVIREAPLFCTKIYLENKMGLVTNIQDYALDELDYATDILYKEVWINGYNTTTDIPIGLSEASETPGLLSNLTKYNVTSIDDIPKFLEFIKQCGMNIEKLTNHSSVAAILNIGVSYDIEESSSVQFNWIKCPAEQSNETITEIVSGNTWMRFVEQFRLYGAGMQQAAVYSRWRAHSHSLFQEYYESYQKNINMTRLEARDKASIDSLLNANGFVGCVPDTFSAAWFWFVFMTTVGYGNASPVTDEGKSMCYTFGFLCILLFGTVLAQAGDIITAIFEDGVNRHEKLKWLSKTWIEVLFWGAAFYSFLCILAATTQSWQNNRLGEDITFKDAYWFSFISVTTVGLGDMFLDGENFAVYDLLGFAWLFLLGFAILSNFLCLLRRMKKEVMQSVAGEPSFKTRLKDRPPLRRTDNDRMSNIIGKE